MRPYLLFLWMCLLASPSYAALTVHDTKVEGVTAWYAEDTSLPIVQLVLTFTGAGTASDPEGQAGRAMMAANLLTEGAGEMDTLAFHQAMEAQAITISTRVTRDDLVMSVRTLKSALPEATRLLTLALTRPRFDPAPLEIARQEQRAALRSVEESASARAGRAWNAALFAGHPYAADGLGNEASIAALAGADLEAYRARYLTRANLQIAAAGDVGRYDLKDALGPLVEALPEAFFPERDLAGAGLSGLGTRVDLAHAGPQSVVVFGGPGIARSDKRYYAYYLLNEVFGGGSLASRLMREVRVKQGLVYGIGTTLAGADAADTFSGQFSTRNETVDAAIEAVKSAARAVADQGISERECTEVKQEVIGGFALRMDSTARIAEIVAMMLRYRLGRDYITQREAYFRAVSCEDMQAAARQLLNPENWLITVVGQPGVAQEAAGAGAAAPPPRHHEDLR